MEIQCQSLTVKYGPSRPIISDMDFEIRSGEIVSLLGASGCGKSTVLRAVAGLLPAVKGQVLVGNRTSAEMRDHIAIVFQDPTLLPWRTVYQNVWLPLELRALTRNADVVQRVGELLITVGFSPDDYDKLPSALSGGMRMRTSLARALVTDPSVLLLDEPFAALDERLRRKLNELLIRLWMQRPRTILFVTHNIAEAIGLSHRIAIMVRGRIAKWVDVPLNFPRDHNVRVSQQFAQLQSQISSDIEELSN